MAPYDVVSNIRQALCEGASVVARNAGGGGDCRRGGGGGGGAQRRGRLVCRGCAGGTRSLVHHGRAVQVNE